MEKWEEYHYLRVNFLKTIIDEVPNNSLFCFYELHTHERDYYFDLQDFLIKIKGAELDNKFFGSPKGIILLDEKAKKAFIRLIDESSITSDLIHFSIFFNNKPIVISYDALENTSIDKEVLKDKIKWIPFYKENLITEV